MSEQRPSIELQNVPRLCYAMQQSAVPWLLAVRLHNPGDAELADPCVTIELEPPLAEPLEWRVAAVPAGDSVALRKPDPRLDPQRLANLLERVRGEVRATVRDGAGTVIATAHSPIEVLAYNEWPGLAVMPPLLAAFVAPNHPALAVLLRDVSARLEERTGNGALDGYQSGDPARARAMLAAVHDAVRAQEVRYVSPPPSFERVGQKVRTPEQVLGDRLATCLDLALVYAALLEHIGLQPLVVLQKEHAFVGAWLVPASTANPTFGPALELRKHCD
ncbi:MAG: hypothetical protein KDE27_20305, partial [Planctomycetes bacterium]|nr:hypothetical protein [Planctomycetota bacterium]